MKMELGKLLGSGSGSDVYEYGDDKVCKLYKNSIGSIDYEYRKTIDAYNNGLPAPRIYEIIEYDGRNGIIMDRINGTPYIKILFNHIAESHKKGMSDSEIFNAPVNLEIIYSTAKVLNTLHQTKCNLSESAAESLKTSCKYNRYITQEEKEIVNTLIDNLPVGDSVCHGDPNPGNIIMQNNQIFLIDWNNCVKGSPLYDLTEYMLMMKYSDTDIDSFEVPECIMDFIREYKEEYARVFLDYYVKLTDIDLSGMDMWVIPLLVSKMGGNNSPQKQETLLRDIRKGLRAV